MLALDYLYVCCQWEYQCVRKEQKLIYLSNVRLFLFLDMYYVPVQFQNMQFANTYLDKFEDTKGVIRSRTSKIPKG
jgi:hypothetical protein